MIWITYLAVFRKKVLLDEYDPVSTNGFLSPNTEISSFGRYLIIGTIGDEYYVIFIFWERRRLRRKNGFGRAGINPIGFKKREGWA